MTARTQLQQLRERLDAQRNSAGKEVPFQLNGDFVAWVKQEAQKHQDDLEHRRREGIAIE